ncbi:MAG: hypothetical protein JZU53_05385 [Paludibacter sp.]|nr:hypothetical protein [Paludibacter sp.]
MKTINSAAELKLAIQQLELQHTIQGEVLKDQFLVTIEGFTPINLLKNALNEIARSPYLIDNIIGSAMGLATGYLSKLVAVGGSNSIVKKLLGSVVQFGVTNIVAQHPEMFKSVGNFLMDLIFHKKKENIV